jgi:hypothetical protein
MFKFGDQILDRLQCVELTPEEARMLRDPMARDVLNDSLEQRLGLYTAEKKRALEEAEAAVLAMEIALAPASAGKVGESDEGVVWCPI